MKKKKIKKYKLGGKTTDPLQAYLDFKKQRQTQNPLRIESPDTAIYDNQIAMARVQQDVNSNPWTQGLDMLGGYAMQQGASMMQQGVANGELTDFADGNGIFGFLKGNNTKGMTEVPGATVTRMALGGKIGGGDKKKGKKLAADVNAATGVNFDPNVANALFEYQTATSSGENLSRQLNLGKYKGRNYFNVKDQGTNFQVNPTANNPQNAQGYNDMVAYLKQMNPNVNIAANGYKQFGKRMAFGGPLGPNGTPIEVEGEEVGEMPDGNLVDFEGPSHEQGGMPLNMPSGSEIFSDRIKIDGVSMADRKKKRKKKEITLEDLMEEDPADALVKNALERTLQVNEEEDGFDTEMQEFIGAQMAMKYPEDGDLPKAAYGWPPDDYYNPDYDPFAEGIYQDPRELEMRAYRQRMGIQPTTTIPQNNAWNTQPKEEGEGWLQKGAKNMAMPTFGDALGIYGNYQQGQVPLDVLLESRGGDTPNVNSFLDYGKDGLKTVDNTKGYVAGQRDSNLKDVDIARNNIITQNRNSARGINTLRSLDLAANQSATNSKGKVYDAYAQQMMQILSQQAGMENSRDSVVMGGEAQRDLADRQDRGAFYSELAKAKMNKAKSTSLTGKSLNDMKERKVTGKALNNMFDYVQMNPITGDLEAKPGAVLSAKDQKIADKFDYEAAGYKKDVWDNLPAGNKALIISQNINR